MLKSSHLPTFVTMIRTSGTPSRCLVSQMSSFLVEVPIAQLNTICPIKSTQRCLQLLLTFSLERSKTPCPQTLVPGMVLVTLRYHILTIESSERILIHKQITASNVNQLKTFPEPISMSRDTGKGGYLNGSKIFLFSDTENFFNTTASQEGEWVGFVSNTAAVDWNNGPLSGQPLTLRDRPGAVSCTRLRSKLLC